MKLNLHFHGVLLFLMLVFILSIHTTKASRLLSTASKQVEVKVDGFKQGGLSTEMENLMGMEECDDGDEECLKRRMLSDAHLDYIYTQHHNP